MEDYTLKYYPMSDFQMLENHWRGLETGMDMTYFQTFAWYEMLWNLNKNIRDKRFEIVFVAVEKRGKTVLIAPLWVVMRTFGKYNRRGFYLFGRGGWSDYLNFIYKYFDIKAVRYMFSQLKLRYGISYFHFDNLPEFTKMYMFLSSKCKSEKCTSQVCVGLTLEGLSFEDYKKTLSKQFRQNIRTAHNRLARDGKSFFYVADDCDVNIEEFKTYRSVRVAKKNEWEGKTLKWRIINFISTKILGRGWYKFVEYAPYSHDVKSKFMTAKTPEGQLCASFNYGVSPDGRSVVLMGVSTNPAYTKYSPGILLLFHFIEEAIESNKYDYIDFTRGNESYKYALGGKEHHILNMCVDINDV